jgi:hypothetical protein
VGIAGPLDLSDNKLSPVLEVCKSMLYCPIKGHFYGQPPSSLFPYLFIKLVIECSKFYKDLVELELYRFSRPLINPSILIGLSIAFTDKRGIIANSPFGKPYNLPIVLESRQTQ